MKRSQILRSTSTREPAEQVWPAFCTIALTTVGERGVPVGVGEDDLRRLAAELQRAADMVARRGGLDQRSDLLAAGEGDEVDAGMVRQRRARLLAEARHDVERALGKAGFRREFGKAQRHEAGFLGRLDDAGVADRERGATVRPNIWPG